MARTVLPLDEGDVGGADGAHVVVAAVAGGVVGDVGGDASGRMGSR